MILSISGYNLSGSSVLQDLLSEYEECYVVYYPEWYIIDQPDGIRDLEVHLCGDYTYLANDVAIQRFINFVESHNDYEEATHGQFKKLSYEYIEKLIQAKWHGRSTMDAFRMGRVKRSIWEKKVLLEVATKKVFKKKISITGRDMFLSVKPHNFLEYTQEYIENLIYSTSGDRERITAVKHLFTANNPVASMKYVRNAKVIVVDRDPRDIYIEARNINMVCFPTEDVSQFVSYYLAWRESENVVNENVMKMNFEDLVLNYDESIEKIEKFLNISNHVRKKQVFKPEISAKNIGLYKENEQYKTEVKYIEEKLGNFCYYSQPNVIKLAPAT